MTTATDTSLATLLRLVEQLQKHDAWPSTVEPLQALDIAALRATAQQHATALRSRAEVLREFGHDCFTEHALDAAADFLQPEEDPR